MFAFLAGDVPRGVGNGQTDMAVNANVYLLAEAIVDEVEAARTHRAVWKVRGVWGRFRSGHWASS